MIASLPKAKREAFWKSLTEREALILKYSWEFWARDNQLPPPEPWSTWLLLAGRGFGKTRVGAETIRHLKNKGYGRFALVAPTAADARDVMVEGESGILAISPPWDRPLYEPSKRRITWNNGALATLYSAEDPDQLRGPQHDAAWCDELAAWTYAQDTWDMLAFGLRLGDLPKTIVTTTPRPIKLVKELLRARDTHTTRGSTMDNKGNLAPQFLRNVLEKYEGTRLGRQEINAEILEDTPDALWQRRKLDETRVRVCPDLARIVVAVDPPATSGENSDECGIVVAGTGRDGKFYIIADVSERGLRPIEWATRAVAAYHTHQADRILAEVNNGGEMVEAVVRQVDVTVSYKGVHASRGKVTRAEPISALYEQGKVHHVGAFPKLEDQMCEFTPDFDRKKMGYSPDRVDALVWALTELALGKNDAPRVRAL